MWTVILALPHCQQINYVHYNMIQIADVLSRLFLVVELAYLTYINFILKIYYTTLMTLDCLGHEKHKDTYWKYVFYQLQGHKWCSVLFAPASYWSYVYMDMFLQVQVYWPYFFVLCTWLPPAVQEMPLEMDNSSRQELDFLWDCSICILPGHANPAKSGSGTSSGCGTVQRTTKPKLVPKSNANRLLKRGGLSKPSRTPKRRRGCGQLMLDLAANTSYP